MYYKVLLQKIMLDKLSHAYAPFISAINQDWLDYTYTDLCNIIHQIT